MGCHCLTPAPWLGSSLLDSSQLGSARELPMSTSRLGSGTRQAAQASPAGSGDPGGPAGTATHSQPPGVLPCSFPGGVTGKRVGGPVVGLFPKSLPPTSYRLAPPCARCHVGPMWGQAIPSTQRRHPAPVQATLRAPPGPQGAPGTSTSILHARPTSISLSFPVWPSFGGHVRWRSRER